jgi:RNA polymerase sigma-70 factor (ECF subfamily)
LPEQTPAALFQNWLRDHSAAVVKIARAYTHSSADCQDLAQEILLQVWSSLPQFEGRASPATWFYRVALNTALSWHRKERRRQTREQPLLVVEELPAAEQDSARQAADREIVDRLYTAIRQLPQTDAARVLLYLDDLTYREMAEVLGISENHVGVKLSRARRALGLLLSEEHDES